MKKYYRYRRKKNKANETYFYLMIVIIPLCGWLVKYNHNFFPQKELFKFMLLLIVACCITVGFGKGFKFMNESVSRNKYVAKRHFEIEQMSGEEFEKFLKAHFEKSGYSVKTTPKSNDYGIDLVCVKSGSKMVIQAKRYKGKVGIAAVQQTIGGMRYYNCNVGIVATNSYFTSNAWELAKRSGVMLWDRNKITELFEISD